MTASLPSSQVLFMFRMIRLNSKRQYYSSNMSFLMAGTLIVLISSLFMNAGANMQITNETKNEFMANQIVMNSIISSASSGLYVVFQI